METISSANPIAVGFAVFALMSLDRILTVAQQREVARNYGKHYVIYPINSIEGNPALTNDVIKADYISKKHIVLSVILSSSVAWMIFVLPAIFQWACTGYFVGLFLLVNTQHLSNLIGYYVGRKGVHGKLVLHRRTALKTQSGRYFAWSVLLLILSLTTFSPFLSGVTAAAVFSSIRQWIWLKSVPPYNDVEEFTKDAENPSEGHLKS